MSGTMQPDNMHGYRSPRVRCELTTEANTIFANLALGEPVD